MSDVMTSEGLDLIFRNARTHNAWLDKPVEDTLLNQVYDLAKMGPTSANMCPMRIIFVKSPASATWSGWAAAGSVWATTSASRIRSGAAGAALGSADSWACCRCGGPPAWRNSSEFVGITRKSPSSGSAELQASYRSAAFSQPP